MSNAEKNKVKKDEVNPNNDQLGENETGYFKDDDKNKKSDCGCGCRDNKKE